MYLPFLLSVHVISASRHGDQEPESFPPEEFNLTSAVCFDPKEDNNFSPKTTFRISKLGVDESYCQDEDGIFYKAGAQVSACCNCFTYTCYVGKDGRGGEYLRWLLTSISAECCQGCDGRVAPPDTVMERVTLQDTCSTLVTTECKYNPGWSTKLGLVTTSYKPQGCCADQNELFPVGSSKLEPRTCSWKTCREGNVWTTRPQLKGKCGCCIFDNKLIADADIVSLEAGRQMKCCKGEMVQVVNERPARCKLPRETGNCTKSLKRWWFNNDTCQEFYYSGCDGNANRFVTLEQCIQNCAPVLNALDPVSDSPSASARTITMAGDDKFTLYEGPPNSKGDAKGYGERRQDTFSFGVDKTDYITVDISDDGSGLGGLLLSTDDGIISDSSWLCRLVGPSWLKAESWVKAKEVRRNDARASDYRLEIADNAKWIWITEDARFPFTPNSPYFVPYKVTCFKYLGETGTGDDFDFCSPSNLCSEGQGDCDYDSDCDGNLVCGDNNCKDIHQNVTTPTSDCCYSK